MEVHHHPHTPRKKWTHYFWEFLMLFLAVFCGFLAENQREHYVEQKREIQFMRSMLEDLKSDTARLSNVIRIRKRRDARLDSLLLIIENGEQRQKGDDMYYFVNAVYRIQKFVSNDRTITQLKNIGGLRIIRKQKVSDSIMFYDRNVRLLYDVELYEEGLIKDYSYQLGKIYNPIVFEQLYENRLSNNFIRKPLNNPQLANDDPELLRDHYARTHYVKHYSVYVTMVGLEPLKLRAEWLIRLIQKEYNLK